MSDLHDITEVLIEALKARGLQIVKPGWTMVPLDIIKTIDHTEESVARYPRTGLDLHENVSRAFGAYGFKVRGWQTSTGERVEIDELESFVQRAKDQPFVDERGRVLQMLPSDRRYTDPPAVKRMMSPEPIQIGPSVLSPPVHEQAIQVDKMATTKRKYTRRGEKPNPIKGAFRKGQVARLMGRREDTIPYTNRTPHFVNAWQLGYEYPVANYEDVKR